MPLNCLLLGLVRCLGCLLQVQLSCGFLRKYFFGRESDCGWPKLCAEFAVWLQGCAGPATPRVLLYPMADWPALSVSCSKLSSAKSWEESLTGPLPNCIEDFGGSGLLKNCVAVHSKDVVGSTDAKTFAEKGKFCLRVLTCMAQMTSALARSWSATN